MMFKYDVAGALTGIESKEPFAGQIKLTGVVKDFQRRVNRMGGLNITLGAESVQTHLEGS